MASADSDLTLDSHAEHESLGPDGTRLGVDFASCALGWQRRYYIHTTQPLQQANRKVLAQKKDCQFVERDEFCRLLLGFNRMVRVDDAARGFRGLRDIKTGVLYVIEREKLNRRQPSPAT